MRHAFLALPLLAFLTAPAVAEQKGDPRCALYGEGFTYSESTGTCIKISGDIRAGYKSGRQSRGFDTQGGVTLDARKETDLGQLRIVVSPKYSQTPSCNNAPGGLC